MQVGRSLRPCWSSSRATGVRCTSGSTPVRSGKRARADAAEARCEELRRSDVDARSRAGSFKWQLDSCRGKLEASRVEVKELRRAVKAAQSSKAEVTRFEQRPSESRIEAARQPPVVSLTEVNQLRKALKVAQARAEKAGLLEYEVRELRKDLQGAETHKETIGSQNREIVRLVAELRRLRDQKDAVKSLSGEGYRPLLIHEIFYRGFRNRRELASWVGITPTPWASGDTQRDQGIGGDGPAWIRAALIQMAWRWVRYQPESALCTWFEERTAGSRGRIRRVMIVALARKLLIALWRFSESGLVPSGAKLA